MLRLKLPGSLAAIGLVCLCASALALAQEDEPRPANRGQPLHGGKPTVPLSSWMSLPAMSWLPTGRMWRRTVSHLPDRASSLSPCLRLLQSGKVDSETALICKRPLTLLAIGSTARIPHTRQPLDAVRPRSPTPATPISLAMATQISPHSCRTQFHQRMVSLSADRPCAERSCRYCRSRSSNA